MKIQFKHIDIENFMSIGQASVDLDKNGFIFIKGINKNKLDNAQSNGAGKSTLINAICWTMTGKTLSGVTTNVVNMFTTGDCTCTLTFTIDNLDFVISRARTRANKGQLKIFINGEDKSGKTITDSQKILESYLPDITIEFLGNVILLGQGLPYKFSNNTPSGRKELLENLSKSNYMIDDLKDRINQREQDLNRVLTDCTFELTKQTTTLNLTKDILTKELEKQNKLKSCDDIKNSINVIKNELERIEESKAIDNKAKNTIDVAIKNLTDKRNYIINEYENKINNFLQETTSKKESILDRLYQLNYRIKQVEVEYNNLNSIKDVCPTCGQRIPNVQKDLKQIEAKEKELNLLKIDFNATQKEKNTYTTFVEENKLALQTERNSLLNDTDADIKSSTEELEKYNSNIANLEQSVTKNKIELAKYEEELIKYNKDKTELEQSIAQHNSTIINTEALIEDLNKKKDNILERLAINKKMLTAVQRDFRGYLLSNVISYIDNKSKDYCNEVFKTDLINICLNGNDIEIKYANKDYLNLSGGEKAKVDLIIQLAIRAMLCEFLQFSCNILCVDECFDNLDYQGTQEILELLTNKLDDVKAIYIISHHEDLDISYDEEIVIEKDEKGVSRIR